jgi:hypothetical protein
LRSNDTGVRFGGAQCFYLEGKHCKLEAKKWMGPGVMIYIPSFIKTGSDIQTLIWGYTDTQTDGKDLCSALLRWAQVS